MLQLMKMNRTKIYLLAWCGALLTGCYKDTLPEEKDYMSKDMNFKKEAFVANLGRMNVFVDIFNADYSTQPLQFSLQSPRIEGKAAPILLEEVDTKQWKQYYTGTETSIAEIEAKRMIVKRPILDLNKQNGQMVVWSVDSNKVKYGKYFFDVLVKNGGGERLFPGLMLDFRRPRPYEPYEFDDLTGIRKADNAGGIIRPTLITGHRNAQGQELKAENVRLYFIKTGNAANKLTFKFVDKDSLPIPISTFNIQRWDSLYYSSKMADRNIKFGFNRQIPKDSMQVTYDITSPFPVLAESFAGDELAEYIFSFSRVSYGYRVIGRIGMKFSIHEQGEWTVVFRYLINPKFSDD